MNFALGELFCGPGGIACGALAARTAHSGITHAWAADIDPDTCETYRANICPDRPESVLTADVRALDMASLPPVDALAFGFPCNDFSIVGEHKGFDGAYGPLYTHAVRALRALRPMWFLAENVGGLRTANAGRALEVILGDFEKAGYRLVPHLYRFERYGVPQARHRLIIIGIRRDLPQVFRVPSPRPYDSADVSCRTALERPPIPPDAANQERTRQSPDVVERLKRIRPGENAFTADLPPELRLNVRGARISQIYRRLHPDRPAYTVTGSGGGGTHIYHWSEPRALTNRERARLQTFPDDFAFRGSKESVRRQIGMAVPPRGARVIFEAVLKTFDGLPYESVEASMKDGGAPPSLLR